MEPLEELKIVALVLWRSDIWHQVPWGIKQVLSSHIQNEIEAEKPPYEPREPTDYSNAWKKRNGRRRPRSIRL